MLTRQLALQSAARTGHAQAAANWPGFTGLAELEIRGIRSIVVALLDASYAHLQIGQRT
jgi:hypothetical protein